MRQVFILFMLINITTAEIVGLILARGGSRGVHLKNLQLVGSESLLQRAIFTAWSADVERIVVSTDHILIALEALKSGAEIFHRSRVTATDVAPSIWGVQEFISKEPQVSIILLLQATSPFSSSLRIRKALKTIDNFDCVFSVIRSFGLRWKDIKTNVIPLNFNTQQRPRRQDWNGELVETGAFYISRRHLILKGYLQNHNCSFVEVSNYESLEVDTYYDLELANILYKKFDYMIN